MLSNAMRSVARDAGLVIADYRDALGFTAVREDSDRYFVFVLNSGEWLVYRSAGAVLIASGRGAASFVTALRRYFEIADAAE